MKVLFFDLETTGTLVNRHGIHQISGMVVIDGEVRESFNFHVQPIRKPILHKRLWMWQELQRSK